MLLQDINSKDLIDIELIDDLVNPFMQDINGRNQAGEEQQESIRYSKSRIVFPSGESLPRCWTDPKYTLLD